ncbi:glycerophosphodiester phosphodiesterase [Planctomicrobium sp. SH527]|uniref:glycerophosphodiester phosphodiesterase n=1 Tax=Planctomicrobium sp. SH527 TaxID=3448123 RepID=UPI003F5C4285
MKHLVTAFLMTLFCGVAAAEAPHVEYIAHRGASFDAPENTISAIQLAWKQGADGTEVDLYLTKDGHIVACHDKTTKRTTGGIDLTVAETTLEQLRELDVGKWKSPKYQGEQMPTFAEVLKAIPQDKKIYIEVKCGPEIVTPLLRDLDEAKLPVKNTIVICFNAKVIAELKKQRPEVPALFLHGMKETNAERLIKTAREIQADGLDLKAGPEITSELVKKVKDAGLRMDVWTVNDPQLALRMIELGVQGITTDRPEFLRTEIANLK